MSVAPWRRRPPPRDGPTRRPRVTTNTWRDTGLICVNGHVVNSSIRQRPQHNADFCAECGVRNISACDLCGEAIPGGLYTVHSYGYSYVGGLERGGSPPKHCTKCGKPYPWTRGALDAARAMAAEILTLSDEERAALAQSLPDLVSDNPQTTVAATRFKRLMTKAG